MTASPQLAQAQQIWQHARQLQNLGHLVEAAQAYVALLRLMPNNWSALYNLALVYQGLDRNEEALESYRRVVTLNPSLSQAHNNLGNLLQALGKSDDALQSYLRAVELDPALATAHFNKALIEIELGHLTDATESLRRVTALTPSHDEAWSKLFAVLFGLKRKQEAISAFYAWENAALLTINRLAAGMVVGRLTADEARERYYLQQLDIFPFQSYAPLDLVPILGNLQYFDIRPELQLACYERFRRAMNAQQKDRVALLPRRSTGKIRVGYLSPDFRGHVMGRIMLDILQAHNRDKFEIYLFSVCNAHFHDQTTQRFREIADGFADIGSLKDRQAAQVIAEVDLDVLVDLAGHTMENRPGVYAHFPARHIVTHLGYHGCLGLDAVEYKFTDRYADTEESAHYQIERPYFLDTCVIPFSHVEPAPDAPSRAELRQSLGVADRIVIGTFVNPIKISPRCLDSWRRILERLPKAVLAFSPYDAIDRPLILAALATRDIGEERTIFIDAVGDERRQRARYLALDMVLDTFPYAGGDTTHAALDMNVPVVTLIGATHAHRVGYSILRHLGVVDTVANSLEEYVDLACRLGEDDAWREEVRAKIMAAKRISPLTNPATHTRALELAYREIAGAENSSDSKMPAREFFSRFQAALRMHQSASGKADLAEADRRYLELLEVQPTYAPLLYARGVLAADRGEVEHAIESFSAAAAADPTDEASRVALAAQLLERDDAAQAASLLLAVVDERSTNIRGHVLLLRALLRLERWEQAASVGSRAIALQPTNSESAFAFGVALAQLARTGEALDMFNRTLVLDERHADAAYNAAILMQDAADGKNAEALFRRVLALEPRHEFAYWRLSELFASEWRIADFCAVATAFGKACPVSFRGRLRMIQARFFQGENETAIELLSALADDLIVATDNAAVEEVSRTTLELATNQDFDSEQIRHLRERSDAAAMALSGERMTSIGPRRPGPLRICYLSSHANGGKVGQMLDYIRRNHDPTRFEVTTYSLGRLQPHEAGADYVDVSGWPADRIALAVQAQNADVLVDVSEFANERARSIVCRSPARASMFYPLGHLHFAKSPYSSRLNAREAELPGSGRLLAGHPVLMEHSPLFLHSGRTVEKSPLGRAAHGIPQSAFVYAVTSRIDFVSRRCLALWRSLLERVPSGQLLVIVPSIEMIAGYRRLLESADIDASRLKLVTAAEPNDATRLVTELADVHLDTIPVNDPLSLISSLTQAVPVVTLAGQFPAERATHAFLVAHGLAEGMSTQSGLQYVDAAVAMALDDAAYSSLANRLRSAMENNSSIVREQAFKEYEVLLETLADADAADSPSP